MLCAPGPERHSEEPAVGVVLCRPPPPGEDHLAVALRDPAEDQPVRAAAVPRNPSRLSLIRKPPHAWKYGPCHSWHCCRGWLTARKSIKMRHSHTASENALKHIMGLKKTQQGLYIFTQIYVFSSRRAYVHFLFCHAQLPQALTNVAMTTVNKE